jgi:hypothetical protein
MHTYTRTPPPSHKHKHPRICDRIYLTHTHAIIRWIGKEEGRLQEKERGYCIYKENSLPRRRRTSFSQLGIVTANPEARSTAGGEGMFSRKHSFSSSNVFKKTFLLLKG